MFERKNIMTVKPVRREPHPELAIEILREKSPGLAEKLRCFPQQSENPSINREKIHEIEQRLAVLEKQMTSVMQNR
jgi:hypothetical protein